MSNIEVMSLKTKWVESQFFRVINTSKELSEKKVKQYPRDLEEI